MRYLKRSLEGALKRALKTFPAVLVTGPRQSGKTTLLRHVLGRRYRFVNFDPPHVRERVLADPVGFLAANPGPLILDEIQWVPGLLDTLKAEIDKDRRPGRFVMTGSQGMALMHGVSQSLAGRVAIMTLYPLGFDEIQKRSKPGKPLDDALRACFAAAASGHPGGKGKRAPTLASTIFRGGYPELCLSPKVDRDLWLGSYVQTYLERDVRLLKQVGDLNSFTRFLKLCAARTGQVLNMSDLARDAGISGPTAKQWLSVLEASHEIFLLPPYYKNASSRLVKAPKLYFSDTALAAWLMDIGDPRSVLAGPAAGALFETLVVTEWRKRFLAQGLAPAMHYWRTQDGLEVDLLIERDQALYPIEIKTTATPNPYHAAHLSTWLKQNPNVKHGGRLICSVPQVTPIAPSVLAVPWQSI